MRSFSVRPARLILVPSTLQSHALVPFRPTSSSSAHPVTYPFTFPSHIIPISPSSHIPFYLSVPHHPHQPIQSHALLPFHFTQHFVPPLRFFSPCPRHPGKVPGISAKTVHFPPWLAGTPIPQTPLAALGISTPGESAGFFGENGSLSPVVDRGTGSTGPSGRTCRFHLRGKCRVFRRKRYTFPRDRPGYRLHSHLWRHPPFPPPGKVPGFPAKTVHFPPAACMGTGSTGSSRRTHRFHLWGKRRAFPRKRFTFPRGMRLQGRSSRACLGKCLVYRHSEKEHLLDLG